jgi:hypothetical protein
VDNNGEYNMILHNRKACIKSIKTNPLAQKIKDKQECTLRNCRVKTHYSTEILERNSF